MFSSDDTIVGIATAPGRGGIGVVRVSGPEACGIACAILARRQLTPRHATLARVRSERLGHGRVTDEVVVTWFPSPRSYTGQHVVEISAHGSPVVLSAIVGSLVEAGGRLARPGEFTFRAFLNGRIDLVQAEAVADLINAVTPLQAQVAFDQLQGTLSDHVKAIDQELLDLVAGLEASLDFPDEGYHFIEPDVVGGRVMAVIGQLNDVLSQSARGRMIREGATVVITGRTNVGKSSLFNALVGQERAIVTEVPGTTRDLVTERMDLHGLPITLVDTAGVRQAVDRVEQEGVERAARARAAADLVLVLIDHGEPIGDEDRQLLDQTASVRRLVVASKSDREQRWCDEQAHRVSVHMKSGIGELRQAIVDELNGPEPLRDTAAISNLRHVSLLTEARASLLRAYEAATVNRAPEEFVLADLHPARASLAEVVGTSTPDEVLDQIFTRFCIGK